MDTDNQGVDNGCFDLVDDLVVCVAGIAAGAACIQSNADPRQCVENSVCNGTDLFEPAIRTCLCTENFYHRDGHSAERKTNKHLQTSSL